MSSEGDSQVHFEGSVRGHKDVESEVKLLSSNEERILNVAGDHVHLLCVWNTAHVHSVCYK